LDLQPAPMDQKQLTRKEPLTLPNQQLELCALSEQQLNDLDHLEQQYVHDTMVMPSNIFSYRKIFYFLTFI
jgi:hypothetical protein